MDRRPPPQRGTLFASILESDNADRTMRDVAATLRANAQPPAAPMNFRRAVEILAQNNRPPRKGIRHV